MIPGGFGVGGHAQTVEAGPRQRGATDAHGTVSTASRNRRRCGATGTPARAAGQHRPASAPAARTPRDPTRRPTRGPPRSAARGSVGPEHCGGSALSAAARPDRTVARCALGSHASVRLTGPSRSSSTQQHRRPNSSHVPSTISPPGASPARIVAQASGTSSTGYWRSTLNARTSTGRSPANSKPPSANSTPAVAAGWAVSTRVRVDLQADHPHVCPHRPQPVGQLQRGHRQRAVAQVDHQRVGRRLQQRRAPAANAPASGRSGAAGCSRWYRA